MFDRVRIWDDQSGNVHYEIKDANGVPFIHTAMPAHEWKALRDKQIDSFPANVSISLLTDLLAVSADVLEDI